MKTKIACFAALLLFALTISARTTNISPQTVTVGAGATVQFSTSSPNVVWTAQRGTIGTYTGLYTAPSTEGYDEVTAHSGPGRAVAIVTVIPNSPPGNK